MFKQLFLAILTLTLKFAILLMPLESISAEPGGGITVNAYVFNTSNTNSTVENINNINSPQIASDPLKHLNNQNSVPPKIEKPKLSAFSPYFGVTFYPYVRTDSFPENGYSEQDISTMLKVILTKSHSMFIPDMGYQNFSSTYEGPYDTTSMSHIARAAGSINKAKSKLLITVSQGGAMKNTKDHPDMEAAFVNAQRSNSKFPGTVWGVQATLWYGYVNGHEMGPEVWGFLEVLSEYKDRAHGLNIKFGVAGLDTCADIVGGPNQKIIQALADTSDYFVCSIFPQVPIAEPEDYFNNVVQQYRTMKSSYERVAPHLEIIVQTGWASKGWSFKNPPYLNSVEKQSKFWQLMQKWAEDDKVKVAMWVAMEYVAEEQTENESSSYGYWKRADDQDDGKYIEKVSGNVVDISYF